MMASNLEVEGLWWLPNSQGYRLTGKLSFDNTKGATLNIQGSFQIPLEFHSMRFKQDFIILGELNDARKVTLIAYHLSKQSQNEVHNNIVSTIEFDIKFIIIGHNFQATTNIFFDSVLVRFDNFSKYFRIFDFERESSGQGLVVRPLEFRINESCSIKINYRFASKDTLEKIFGSMKGIYITIELFAEKTLDRYLEVAPTNGRHEPHAMSSNNGLGSI